VKTELHFNSVIRMDRPLEPQVAAVMAEKKRVDACAHKWGDWHSVNGYTWRNCKTCRVKELQR